MSSADFLTGIAAILATMAKKIGFTGVGTYKDFVHVDTRPNVSYWNG